LIFAVRLSKPAACVGPTSLLQHALHGAKMETEHGDNV
jgi:hypothetical protein